MISAGILTISDKGYAGKRDDLSGKEIKRIVKDEISAEIVAYEICPDEVDLIEERLLEFVDERHIDLVLTTGGTGVSPRDVTPEATKSVIDKELPGFSEVMRAESRKKTPHAMTSRAVCGIRKQSLILNLPGSPKAVRENLAAILPAITHAIEKIKGSMSECGIS